MELGGKSPGDRLRRRRPGRRPRLHPVRRLLAQRRALHGRQPHPGRALDLRRVLRALRRPGDEHRRRRPARPGDRGRRARASGALRQGDELRRDRQDARAGCVAGGGRPDGPADRQLRRADRVRRRRRRMPGSSRRRSSARSSRSPRSTPTTEALELANGVQVRPRRLHLDQRPQARPQLRPAGRGRHGLAQLAQRARPAHPVRRGQGLRPRPRGRLPLDRLLHRRSRPCTSPSATCTPPDSARPDPDPPAEDSP